MTVSWADDRADDGADDEAEGARSAALVGALGTKDTPFPPDGRTGFH